MKSQEDVLDFDQDNFENKMSTKVHPYQWIDIKLDIESIAIFKLPMSVTESGYSSTINMKVVAKSIKTSLNHALLTESAVFNLNVIMPTPLVWNERREWQLSLTMPNSIVFPLKQHVGFLADLGRDFTYGPQIPIEFFIPTVYKLTGQLNDYQFLFVTNQFNVIPVHIDSDENAFLTLKGDSLKFEVCLPFDKYLPLSYQIPIQVLVRQFELF